MDWSMLSIKELNEEFSVDDYISMATKEKIEFRSNLKACIRQLTIAYKLKVLTKEDILDLGMKQNSKVAYAITLLLEISQKSTYEQVYHFKDSIRILRGILFEELFNGKMFFYDLQNKAIGIDPNYLPFVLGSKYKLP